MNHLKCSLVPCAISLSQLGSAGTPVSVAKACGKLAFHAGLPLVVKHGMHISYCIDWSASSCNVCSLLRRCVSCDSCFDQPF